MFNQNKFQPITFLFRLIIYTMISLLLMSIAKANAKKQILRIFTYDSFVADWGPGPAIKKGFEEKCACEVKFTAFAEAGTLLSRVLLEGDDSKADIILGLDSSMINKANELQLFSTHELDFNRFKTDLNWKDENFIPYDYGYFAFIYDENKSSNIPKSFADLITISKELNIIIQDARSSTPGLGLMLWVKHIYGDKAANYWKKLSPQLLTITKGWSEAYGLFLKGEADLVLSYTTSPAYHMIAEGKDNYKAIYFDEGNYSQIEVAGILKSSKQIKLARAFLDYLSSNDAQKIIPTTNWMYPAINLQEELPAAFDISDKLQKSLKFDNDVVAKNKKAWLEEWRDALSK